MTSNKKRTIKKEVLITTVTLLGVLIGYAGAQIRHGTHEPVEHNSAGMMDHQMHDMEDHHMHHGTQEVANTEITPTLAIELKEDAMQGLTMHLITSNFTFAPESVDNQDIVQNQGHAHLYINGEKIGRIYGQRYHIPSSWLREHNNITVSLNADNHDTWVVDGQPIEQTVHFMHGMEPMIMK